MLHLVKFLTIHHNYNDSIISAVDSTFNPIGLTCDLDGDVGYIDVDDVELDCEFEYAIQEVVQQFGPSVVTMHF